MTADSETVSSQGPRNSDDKFETFNRGELDNMCPGDCDNVQQLETAA